MRRRAVLAVAGWLAAAAAAVATGVLALAIIGEGLSGPSVAEPLSEADVASALAKTPPPTRPTAPSSPSPSNPAARATAPAPRLLTTPGGSVVARCAGGLATIVSWTPAQGYAVTKADSEPDDSPQVRFERGEDRVDVRVEWGPYATWKRN
jgi:hypothetical protein